MSNFRFIFFGTPEIAVASLEALKAVSLLPALIVTAPSKPQGRGLVLIPSPVRAWADANDIRVLSPEKLSDESFVNEVSTVHADVFTVVAYGKMLSQKLLAMAARGTLNMHPSLLPKHRGPSPIESQILMEERPENVGVSVMLLDEEMDHGSILSQKKDIPDVISTWPMRASLLYPILAKEGGALLAETLPKWVSGEIAQHEQDHTVATYSTKAKKEDGHLDLSGSAEENYRKFLAYDMWPRTYFMTEKKGKPQRVIVTDAILSNGAFVIKKVIPEGKKEMLYEEFLRRA